MPELWAVSDASLVLLKDMELFRTVIPSKIFESMAMKKPIILGVEGESRELVEAAQAGISIAPESGKGLAAAVSKLAENSSLRDEFGSNGREYVTRNYARTMLAKRYRSLIELLVNGAKTPSRATTK
jgi:glycosyltransferase involved in cell wall biosynthesis